MNFWGTRASRFFAASRAAESGDDSARVDVRPGAGLFPSLVVRAEPRQHGGQVGDAESFGAGEVIGQAMVEQIGRVPGRPLFVVCTAEDIRLVGSVGRLSLSE